MQLIQKNRDRQQERETLHSLHGIKKIQFIWDYYKLPLVILGIFLYVIIYVCYKQLSYKDTILYVALVNVNAGEKLTEELNDGFMEALNTNTSKNQLQLYSGLYLTDNANNAYFEYTYASRMKILASIDGEFLDVVLMDREAFDAFAQNGYLCNVEELLSDENPNFYEDMEPFFEKNIFIKEDNSDELLSDPSIPYRAVTEEYPMGFDLSQSPFIKQARFEETVYLGILANSPRKDMAVAYLEYLFYGDFLSAR